MKELTKKLADVQTKLKAKKSSYNSFGKYYFRKAEDILEGVKPFLLQHNIYVTVSEELIATDPVPMIKTTATISDGTDAIHATAVVGVDMQQKGMQTAQQFGAASTYAKKYALAQKPKTKITKEQMAKAIKFVKDGGSVDAIKKKYELSAAQLKQLA